MSGWNIAKQRPVGEPDASYWMPVPPADGPAAYETYEGALGACQTINAAESEDGNGGLSYATSTALDLFARIIENGGQIQLGPLDLWQRLNRGYPQDLTLFGAVECLILANDGKTLGGIPYQGISRASDDKTADLREAVNLALFAYETGKVQEPPPQPVGRAGKVEGLDFPYGTSATGPQAEPPDPDQGEGAPEPGHDELFDCALCGELRCTLADLCEGCGKHVCEACDHPDPEKVPSGDHDVEAHAWRHA